MKPGPAISSASTQRCTAGWACSAATRALASSRGFFFKRLGQLHGRGDGEVAMRGLLGRLEGPPAVAGAGRHLGHGVAFCRAASRACLAWIMGRF
jgi:hypothetical protein